MTQLKLTLLDFAIFSVLVMLAGVTAYVPYQLATLQMSCTILIRNHRFWTGVAKTWIDEVREAQR